MNSKTLCTIIALTMIGSAGCKKRDNRPSPPFLPEQTITVSAKPISVTHVATHHEWPYLNAVVEIDGNRVLAYQHANSGQEVAKAAAIIQAEIVDGDKDLIKLIGNYAAGSKDKFVLSSIEADGFKVEF